MIQYNNKI